MAESAERTRDADEGGPSPPPVALVGAGPGHPGLLTLRAAELLARADVVLYDRLVPVALLDHAPPSAQRVCVDQLPGCHAERWPHIHQSLIEFARQGLRVVRLKGGDPFLFGRGAEEAEALRAAGIEYEVVPGVTAGLGASACAGIPLTHRRLASAVAFVTGHERPDKPETLLDWPALARFPGTLVFYMAVARLPHIVQMLVEHGKAADTPAAAVHWGSTTRQRTVEAPLAGLPEAVRQAEIKAPALIVVGPVVSLRAELAWFERRPLFGKRALVTRPRQQAGSLARRLEELGAQVSVLPAVEVRGPADWGPVDRALDELASFGWLVFTSANGVEYFLRRLLETGRDLRALGPVRLAAIGPATSDALRAYHLTPDLVPDEYRSEALAAALKGQAVGGRVLLARADRGRDLLREELSAVAEVVQVAVYSQVDAEGPDPATQELLEQGHVDYVTVTSSNIARSLVRALGPEALAHVRSGRTALVSISPVTSATIRELGLPVAAEASVYTAEGVVAATCALAQREGVSGGP
jgi:uroporphyrinogen III methyltransferase/synthase